MKYLLIGNLGQLGKEFEQRLKAENHEVIGVDYQELDIGDLPAVLHAFKEGKPDIVINCAAYNLVDKAETDFDAAYRTNSLGVHNLAYACRQTNTPLVHYSTDYVFDGTKDKGLYTETDQVNPLSQYGKSKYMGETFLKDLPNSLLFRLSWVYGDGKQNFIYKFQQWIKDTEYIKISVDEFSIPTYTKLIVELTLKALEKGMEGLYHMTNSGYCSRYELAKFIVQERKLKKILYPGYMADFNLPASRPQFSAMDNGQLAKELNVEIPSWQESLKNFLNR